MSNIRPELSRTNPYWINRHRYYELKHFCRQYLTWKALARDIDGVRSPKISGMIFSQTVSNPTVTAVQKREEYTAKMKMIEEAAKEASPELWFYILKGVTEECSYENLRFYFQMPASKDLYYDSYRKFFYILDRTRK